MPYKKLLFCLILLVWSLYGYAQKATYFQTIIKSTGVADQGLAIIQLANRDFMVAGGHDLYPAKGNYSSIVVSKTDSIGRVLWSKTYESEISGIDQIGPLKMIVVPDSNIVILATIYSSGTSISTPYLMKIDQNGKLLWAKTIESGILHYGYGLANATGGGFIISGITSSINYPKSLLQDAMLIKTNDTGTVVWYNSYGRDITKGFASSFYSYGDALYNVCPTLDGNYLVCGHVVDHDSSLNLLMKVDKNGKLIWYKEYGDTGNDNYLTTVFEMSDHSIYGYGYSRNNFSGSKVVLQSALTKFNPSGNILWAKNYGNGNYTNFGWGSTICYDPVQKCFYIASSSFGNWGLINMKVDTSGKVLHFKDYNKKNDWFIYSMILLAGGKGTAIVGFIEDTTNYKRDNIFFAKTDTVGNSNSCSSINSTFYTAPISFVASSYPLGDSSNVLGVDGSGGKTNTITLYDSSYCAPYITDFRYQHNCTGIATQFFDSSYEYPTSWKWNFGDGASSASSDTSSLKNPTHVYKYVGTYIVRLISSNGILTDTMIKKINVSTVPTPFSFDTLICYGSTIKLRASGANNYIWRPNKLVSDSTAAIVTTSPKVTQDFVVMAGNSSACLVYDTLLVIVDKKPAPPIIQYTTVKKDNEIDVIFQRSFTVDVKSYILYRATNGGVYKEIDSIPNLSNAKIDYLFADTTVKADSNYYTYKIVDIDSCGGGLDTSTEHQPVLLKGNAGDMRSILNWTKYQGYAYDTAVIQRFDSITHKWENLRGLTKKDSSYIDSSYLKCNKTVYYRIVTYLNDGDTSYSDSIPVTPYESVFKDTPQMVSVSKISTSTSSGSVFIQWANSNRRLQYNRLYYSVNGKSFNILKDSIPVAQDSFVQTGINTQSADQYYYVVGVDSCMTQSPKSIIHKTITLTVSIGELLHKLNWTPYLGFKVKKYNIEKLVGAGFVAIDSVPGNDTSSRYFPAPCNHVERYIIEAIGYNPGEISFSDSMGRKALDTIPPDAPVLKNATAINDTSARLDFKGSDSLATYKFVIQRSINGNWGTIGTVLFTHSGQSATYIDSNINTVKNHVCYTVIAIDSCLNSTPGDTFCLINLQGKEEQMSDSLHWSPFVGYGLSSYVILVLNKSGGWDTLGIVANGDTDYFTTHVQCATLQTYKIAGYEKLGNEITLSNPIILTPFDTVKPPAPELYYATVLPNQTVKLSWQWNPKGLVKYFEIWRGTNHTASALIDSVTADSIYIDKSANMKDSIYSYFVIAIDSCNLSNRSKPSQSEIMMHLKLYSLYCSPQVQVQWTGYAGAGSYNILRSTDGVNFTSIGAVNASTTVYADNSVTIGKQYYYKTEATDKLGYTSYSDTLGIIPRLIPLADSAQIVYATVLKSDETTGEIYIQWKRAVRNDTNARGYYLYSFNTANGKYTLLKDVTDLNDTGYIQNNINTLQSAYKYYIVTYNVCDVGINSKIHKTVLLNVQNNNLNEQLNWNNYFGIPIKSYSVYKSKDGGSQYLVNNAGIDSSYSDSNITCNHNYTYQVQALLANGEISFSDSITVKSYDTIKPVTKPITDVTVIKTGVTDGEIKIDWSAAIDKELDGYNIYRSIDGLYWSLIIDHWPGTSLIDTGLDTYDQSYYYKIQPVDSCGNEGPFTIYHRSIYQRASAKNGYNQINWNSYEGWKVKKYLLYKNGVLIDSLANNVFAFKDTLVICNTSYQYLIKAIDSSNDTIISASNSDSAKALNHIPPQRVYIKTVTVSKPNKAATISWTPSPSYDVKNYFIFRKSAATGNMIFIDSTTNLSYIDSNHIDVPPLGVGGSPNSPTDGEPDCYYVFTRDHCGNQSDGSNQGCIIILSAKNQPGYNQLSWNSYQDWYDGVQGYNVYENNDSLGWQLIGTTTSANKYTDSKLGDSAVNFCYQVEAIENPGQYNQLSRSTVVCVHQDATVFIPNSFTPYDQDGLNDFFGPVGAYIKSYDMKIFNRWGELIYSEQIPLPPLKGGISSQPNGWDGKYKGQFVQQGVYIYLITVTDYNGKESYFKGTITMFE